LQAGTYLLDTGLALQIKWWDTEGIHVSSDYRTYTYSVAPSTTKAVRWLLIINVAMFLVQLFVLKPLYGSAYLSYLALVPSSFLGKGYLWQIVTYMFLHGGVIHILFNMLFLWMMGSEIERYWGSKEFLKYYFITGCGAGLVNVLVQPHSKIPTIGASGAIFGLIIAFALAFPDRELLLYFFIRIKAKYFAVLVGVLELLALLALPGTGIARFAHLGGLVIGYVYIKRDKWTYPIRRLVGGWRRDSDHRTRRRAEEERQTHQREIDRILDKINTGGIESLSDREKAFLERQGGRRS
jgi:membrane associated rhomboid family serine protease